MDNYLRPLIKQFKQHSDGENAVKMKSYMKDRFEFYGIKSPQRQKIIKEFIAENGLPESGSVENIVFECFEMPEREVHYFAIEFCGKLSQSWKPKTIKLFEKMALKKSWWDSVDSINTSCVKPYFANFPGDTDSITQSWIDSGNIWLQRLGIIFQLRLTGNTDTKILARNILQLKDSGEFFVQKAIGWALRDYWRTDPDWVIKFVKENELKPLSKREALKRI